MSQQPKRHASTRVSQNAPASRSASARAWTEALTDPRFREAVDTGLADVKAERTVSWTEVKGRIRSS